MTTSQRTHPRLAPPPWLDWLLPSLLAVVWTSAAWGQACLTCRTESCPTKQDVKAWCGIGKDPLAPPPPAERPSVERQAIQIGSDPPGATVRLGGPEGDILGTTPIKKLLLAHGLYRLWLTVPGYQASALTIDVQPRGPRQYFATLRLLETPLAANREPTSASAQTATSAQTLIPESPPPKEPEGRLSVRSNRSGVEVRVDGGLVGITPMAELRLAVGQHKVTGQESGQEVIKQVVLSATEPTFVELRFPVRRWVWIVAGVAAATATGLAVGLGAYYGTSVPRPDGLIGGGWH